MLVGRALHFVFKISDRTSSSQFFRNILGMKVLRHEEFKEGCEAKCNGPYDNRWSKTMIGYGPEDTHFVFELTYNYNADSYERGNDFVGVVIRSKQALENARKHSWPIYKEDNLNFICTSEGYKFYIIDDEQPIHKDPVEKIQLASSDLKQSIEYWNEILHLKVLEQSPKCVSLAYDENQIQLELHDIGNKVDHKTAFGRIAFSVPTERLHDIQKVIKEKCKTILTDLISLDTPGKATVVVIILADPDGHEICFVGDESFRELSQTDPEAEIVLDRYIKKDNDRKKEAHK